ncbi:hypothetical protein K470DRAFT_194264, partial [Piedraia hortae CBS 480.64]
SSSSSGTRGSVTSAEHPTYGSSGRFYAGGSSSPYKAGNRSPVGLVPVFIEGAALGTLGGAWLHGAYAYSYPRMWDYLNNTSDRLEMRPAKCLCAKDAVCGCDYFANSGYMNQVANNKTLSRVANFNDTDTLFINGTLTASTS